MLDAHRSTLCKAVCQKGMGGTHMSPVGASAHSRPQNARVTCVFANGSPVETREVPTLCALVHSEKTSAWRVDFPHVHPPPTVGQSRDGGQAPVRKRQTPPRILERFIRTKRSPRERASHTQPRHQPGWAYLVIEVWPPPRNARDPRAFLGDSFGPIEFSRGALPGRWLPSKCAGSSRVS